ncbi:MAG: adenylate/guanylate cyclase domain-containing protein [Cyanobacteria bacterium P01_D01_bin.1]
MNTPVHPQNQRTLAAIVITDAVSFSKRMSQDEEKALSIINQDLKLITDLCDAFEGKILKTVGDGVLMYFVSAVQAAGCAVEIQKTFLSHARGEEADNHFTHRVGVHLGDIFFNQKDMMGTGVNIAARLEAAATPGAVCMSQVVYNVVKSQLELDAEYIGELSLKNISEAVAAYSVWPLGMRPEKKEEDSTEAVASLAVTPINAALKQLSEHPNSRRIKKLLYGTHQCFWENNTTVLESFSLKRLLESLTDRNPTLEECRNSLYAIVGTLNRQVEYAQVAEIILDSLNDFYIEPTGGTVETVRSPTAYSSEGAHEDIHTEREKSTTDADILSNPHVALYRDTAARLSQGADPLRTKKLLYCLCYDKWESDASLLSHIDTSILVETLYQQVTTVKGLQNRIVTVLMRLNRRSTYGPIANQIFREFQALYPEIDSQISLPANTSEIEDPTAENTQINSQKKPNKRWLGDKSAVSQSSVKPMLIRSVFSN